MSLLGGALASISLTACPEERVFDVFPPVEEGNAGEASQGPNSEGQQVTEIGALNAQGLTVVPSSLDLGSIAEGFAARGRLSLRNSGNEVMPLPTVSFGTGSASEFTLVQNLCFEDLAPGEQCELRVQVVPSAVGELSGTLEISAGSAGNASVPISAYGLQRGDILMVPAAGSFEDFGEVRVGESAVSTFTVTNPGATNSGPLSFHFNLPEFAALEPAAGECVDGSTDLAPGESCDVRVAFRPTERGAVEAVASVSSDGAGSMSLTLRGEGQVAGLLAASVTTMNFGGVVPGSFGARDVIIQNQGDDPLTLGPVTLDPPETSAFTIVNSNCGDGVVLGSDESCSVQVEFRPTEEGTSSGATLIVQTADGSQSQQVTLQGRGLTRGNLVVAAGAPGGQDFGRVLLGQSAERQFLIENPAEQPSGFLTLSAGNGFEVIETAGDGGCVSGQTELDDGQSCEVTVRFFPQSRGTLTGALTVDSALAGAASLTLSGQGIAAARLVATTGSAEAAVDFGRVTTGEQAARSITVENAGDQPLPPPTLEVAGATAAQATAFRFESTCTTPLGFEESCDITLNFAPTDSGPHSATLDLSSEPGGRASVLLVGEGREPGRLVVAAAAGSTTAFGDVAIGQTAVQTFSVSNPGGVASGPLTIRSDDSQFVVNSADCAAIPPAGLIDSEACAFDVTFTPATNLQTEARVSVLSASAGETGIAVTGRGRAAAVLAATVTERGLGRAIIGQGSTTENAFTWTVRNDGDLESGALTVQNTNAADFDLSTDNCGGQTVAGTSNCTLTVTFAPDTEGPRTSRVTVSDSVSGSSVALQVSGDAIRLRNLGEACVVNTDCGAPGICAGGVCCNQQCGATCQSCQTGQCQALTGQQPCGNGSGVCFGVNQCELPAGTACNSDAECGGNLLCKQCRFGGRQCTPPDGCCGGCDTGFTCVGGQCECAFQDNGLQGIDCGGGLCAFNRADACCPGSPPAGCNCDPSDNRCKECIDNSDCPQGPAGTFRQCQNNQCSNPCSQGEGFTRSCNDGRCVRGNECCENCAATGRICNGNGQCIVPGQPNGTACDQNSDCQSGDCRAWFRDRDNDGFGSQDPIDIVRLCGPNPPNAPGQVFRANSDDCCDSNANVRPNQTEFFEEGYFCGGDGITFDYNCRNGEELLQPTDCSVFSPLECPAGIRIFEIVEGCGGFSFGGACTLTSPNGPGMFGDGCDPADDPLCVCNNGRANPTPQPCR